MVYAALTKRVSHPALVKEVIKRGGDNKFQQEMLTQHDQCVIQRLDFFAAGKHHRIAKLQCSGADDLIFTDFFS